MFAHHSEVQSLRTDHKQNSLQHDELNTAVGHCYWAQESLLLATVDGDAGDNGDGTHVRPAAAVAVAPPCCCSHPTESRVGADDTDHAKGEHEALAHRGTHHRAPACDLVGLNHRLCPMLLVSLKNEQQTLSRSFFFASNYDYQREGKC